MCACQTTLFFKIFEGMVGKTIEILKQKKWEGIKAWMGLCRPLGPVPVNAHNHVTIAQSGFIEKKNSKFSCVTNCKELLHSCSKIKPFSTTFEKLFCATRSHQERCQALPASWVPAGEDIQMILGKCSMPSAIRKSGGFCWSELVGKAFLNLEW